MLDAVGGRISLLKYRSVGGALLGVTGGYMGSRLLDLGFDDASLQAIADSLNPDSSAVVAAVEIKSLAEVVRRLAPYHGRVVHDTLPDRQGAQLASAAQASVLAS